MATLKYLIDTNVFIPLEPTSAGDIAELTESAVEFARKANAAGFPLFVHPAQAQDIQNDRNDERRNMRETLFRKYPLLPQPPASIGVEGVLGNAAPDSHDWVDHQLLAALNADAVDYLVTEDVRIHRKAKRLHLNHRVAFLADASSALDSLADRTPRPLPAVEAVRAHNLNATDRIFDSIRSDYPPFDEWLSKCRLEHRHAWIIKDSRNGYAGVCIVNYEECPVFPATGKVLKLCTFKVSDSHSGFRYGELLLRHVLAYAKENSFAVIFIETFPKQERLIAFLQEFGFDDVQQTTAPGEIRLVKRFEFTSDEMARYDGLEFNRRFGPSAIKWTDSSGFVVPIKPKYHDLLFPESTDQLHFFEGQRPCSNALRKAYLCNSVSREIQPGAILLFYRSEDWKSLSAIGITGETLVSDSENEIAHFAGKRTVYPLREIAKLCEKEVLAILFRQARILAVPIGLDALLRNRVISAAPQSITKLNLSARKWIQTQVD